MHAPLLPPTPPSPGSQRTHGAPARTDCPQGRRQPPAPAQNYGDGFSRLAANTSKSVVDAINAARSPRPALRPASLNRTLLNPRDAALAAAAAGPRPVAGAG